MNELKVREYPLAGWFMLFFGVLALLSLVSAIISPEGFAKEIRSLVYFGCPVLGPLLCAGGVYMSLHPPLVLALNTSGLWIQKHKLEIPWKHIRKAEIIRPHERKSTGERLLSDAAEIAVRGRASRAVFLAITLTKRGKREFGDKDYVGRMTRRSLQIHEDFLVLPGGTYIEAPGYDRAKVFADVVREIRVRARNARPRTSTPPDATA